MKSSELRKKFLDYFAKNGHRIVPSSRIIPEGDPTILFTNAGMNQFKNVFLGLEEREYKRAASSQKCLRAGGKHNDLENVGFTARHHTFFEMLGNFSFGDYFKKEAIHFAWEFITKEVGLPKNRLYISVFESDEEAANIWHKEIGIAKDRIYRFGEKDNFWRMGNSGPCGPCSEIFYDLGPEVGGDPKKNVMGGEGDRYIEFWNLVFMQYNESESGEKSPLPKPSVDTGMGLERLATILQGKLSNYENDLFQSLIGKAEKLTGLEYIRDFKSIKDSEAPRLKAQNVAMRVLADHARATAFLMADGVLPSNEGRGYVLRRIMRRALRYGRGLSKEQSLLPEVIDSVIQEMGGAYEELWQQKDLILNHTRDEEKRFFQTLDQGTEILSQEISKLKSQGKQTLDGKMAFKLYDTFGFPIDLTELIAKENNVQVDQSSFERLLNEAREKAKASWKSKGLSVAQTHLIQLSQDALKKTGPTQFTGYKGPLKLSSKVIALSNGQQDVKSLSKGQSGIVVTESTPFYAESGGQAGDSGTLRGSQGEAEVLDCTKLNDVHLHHIRVTDGSITLDETCHIEVDAQLRLNTANNHSATHLLHSALRKVLGTHVTQAGSLVTPDRLRFDFTHNRPLTPQEITDIEDLVNQQITKSNPVEVYLMPPNKAIEAGALALFGEKYGEEVRVLKMGDFSMELCGGTHVQDTSQIRLFKIVTEGGVSSGVRRIEAITGEIAARFAIKHIRENQEARSLLGAQENWQKYLDSETDTAQLVHKLREDKKALEKEVQKLKGSQVDVEALLKTAQPIKTKGGEGKYLFADLEINDRKLLSELSDKLKDRIQSGAIILVGRGEGAHPIIVSVTKNLTGSFSAGKILGEVASCLGGKGGGRPDFAQGAGKDLSQMHKAQKKCQEIFG